MKIAERYAVARNTSNLKVSASTTLAAADVLIAAGWVAQRDPEAMLLWDAAFRGKTHCKLALCDLLEHKLTAHMLRHSQRGNPRRITRETVAWWMDNACQTCGGEGHEVVPDTSVRYDHLCSHCDGSGKQIPLPDTLAHQWLADKLNMLAHHAAGRVMDRLRDDMEL